MNSNKQQQPVKSTYVLPHMRAAAAAAAAKAKPTSVDIKSAKEFPSLAGSGRGPAAVASEPVTTTVLNFKTMLDDSARKAEAERKRVLLYKKGSPEALRRLGWEILTIKPLHVLSERLYNQQHGLPLDYSDTYKDMEGYIPGLVVQRYEDDVVEDGDFYSVISQDSYDMNMDQFVDDILYEDAMD